MKDSPAAVTMFAATLTGWLAELNAVLITLLAAVNLAFVIWRWRHARKTIEKKDDDDWQIPVRVFAGILLVACLCGCAAVSQSVLTQDGGKVQQTRATAFVLWQGGQVVERVRVSNGKTQSIGVYGLDQETDASTNVVSALREIRGIIGK